MFQHANCLQFVSEEFGGTVQLIDWFEWVTNAGTATFDKKIQAIHWKGEIQKSH